MQAVEPRGDEGTCSMRLRVRDSDGARTITLSDNATFAELKREYALQAGVPVETLEFKSGYPAPRPVTLEPQERLVPTIQNGDQIIVSRLSARQPLTESNNPGSAVTSPFSGGGEDDESMPIQGGLLVRREMKDDNSCLFNSISLVLTGNSKSVAKLREIAASIILSDPDTYSAAILGQTPDSYCSKLRNPNSWGGAIELKIFSDYFHTEICSVDVQTTRIDRFGEGLYPQRAFVIYSGIHYDAIARTPGRNAPTSSDQTIFTLDDAIVEAAKEIARKLNKRKQYTDLAGFTLRCNTCKAGLKGQREAHAHAQSTGHDQFAEYD